MKWQAATADYKKLSDEELVFRYTHRNEPVAINILFERYGHLVYGICLKHFGSAAKTHLEQIFIDMLEAIAKVKMTDYKAWLLRFVEQYCEMKTKGVASITKKEKAPSISDEELKYKIENRNLYSKLEKAVNDLPAQRQSILKAFYLENKTCNEIAAMKSMDTRQVMDEIKEGRRSIKRYLSAVRKVKI